MAIEVTKVNVHNVNHSVCVIVHHMNTKSTTHCTSLFSLIGFLRALAKCDIGLNELQFTGHKRFHFLVQMGHSHLLLIQQDQTRFLNSHCPH